MIDVNWDLAPEGSVAVAVKIDDHEIAWVRESVEYNGWSLDEWDTNINDEWKIIATRPQQKTVADAVEWNGEGLPPIGIECEIKHKDATKEWAQPDFHKETVKTYGDELFIIAGRNGNRETVGVINDYFFRPIKPKMSEETVSKLREYPKWCLGRKAGLVSDLIEEFISEHDII